MRHIWFILGAVIAITVRVYGFASNALLWIHKGIYSRLLLALYFIAFKRAGLNTKWAKVEIEIEQKITVYPSVNFNALNKWVHEK